MDWIKVALLNDVKNAEQLEIDFQGKRVLLIWHNNQVYGLANRCSHAFKPLQGGKLSQDTIQCPFHGATFCLKTGNHLSPPAFKGIAAYNVKIEDDTVFIQA